MSNKNPARIPAARGRSRARPRAELPAVLPAVLPTTRRERAGAVPSTARSPPFCRAATPASAVRDGHHAPQPLRHYDRPGIKQQHLARIMFRHQEDLIARDMPHRFRMPAPKVALPWCQATASGTYHPAHPACAQRSPKSTSSRYDSNRSSSSPVLSNNSNRNKAAVMGAAEIRFPSRNAGPSIEPWPTRHAAPPRQTAS